MTKGQETISILKTICRVTAKELLAGEGDAEQSCNVWTAASVSSQLIPENMDWEAWEGFLMLLNPVILHSFWWIVSPAGFWQLNNSGGWSNEQISLVPCKLCFTTNAAVCSWKLCRNRYNRHKQQSHSQVFRNTGFIWQASRPECDIRKWSLYELCSKDSAHCQEFSSARKTWNIYLLALK